MKNKIVALLALLFVLFNSACDESTITPDNNDNNKNTLPGSFVFYTYLNENSNKASLRMINLKTSEDTMFRDSALVIAVKNNQVYYITNDVDNTAQELHSCDLTGNNDKKICPVNMTQWTFPDISDDGGKMLVGYYNPGLSIHCIDLTTLNDIIIMSTNYEGDPYPMAAFLSGSNQIGLLYSDDDNTWPITFATTNTDGSNLAEHITGNIYGYTPYSMPNDKSKIALIEFNEAFQTSDVILYDINSKEKKTITSDGTVKQLLMFSPDGSKLAFYRTPGKFCIMNIDGTNEVSITNIISNNNDIKGFHPFWSDDGRSILFQTSANTSGGDVYTGDLKIVDIETLEVKTLVEGEVVFNAFMN